MRVWQGRVRVCREVSRTVAQVGERQTHLEVIDVEIEPGEHNADLWVQRAAIRNVRVVLWFHVSAEGRVGATAVRHILGLELGLDA